MTEAVAVARAATQAVPAGHPDRAGLLFNLASVLWERFAYGEEIRVAPSGQLTDQAGAIDTLRAAARVITADHPERPRILARLGFGLRIQSERTGNHTNLADAIEVGRAASQGRPPPISGHGRGSGGAGR